MYIYKLCSFIIAVVFIFIIVSGNVLAQTATEAPEKDKTVPTEQQNESLSEQINDLKERIASRVAELRLVERRGIIGTVSEVSSTQLTLTDPENNTRLVDVDEITKFASPAAKDTFGISDITKGSRLSVIGLYNKQSKRITARFVNSLPVMPLYVNGTVNRVNKDDFTITVFTKDEKAIIVDIEKITKTSTYSEEDNLKKSGFSQIEAGNRVNIIGYPDKNEKNRLSATRVILFPGFPKNPDITIPNEELVKSDEPITSTGSGKKLTPIQ